MAHRRHHHHHHRGTSQGAADQYGGAYEIRDVWEGNLDEEIANMLEVVEQYPYVAMVRLPRASA